MTGKETARLAEYLLEKTGRETRLETGETFPALFLPQKPSQTPAGQWRSLGWEETRRFTYYGPGRAGGEQVEEGSRLTQGNRRFRMVWIADWKMGEETVVRWGEAMPEEGESL